MSCSLTLSRTGGKSKNLVVKPVVPEDNLIRKVLLLLRPKIGGAHCTPGSNGPAPPEIGGGPPGHSSSDSSLFVVQLPPFPYQFVQSA